MSFKVLIVDDSKLARMSVARALSVLHPDWTRLEASNADEALAIAAESEVDITLLDYNMPGTDGLTLATELKTMKPSMPVAVVSANHQTEIVNRAQEVGATFLAKPLTEALLAQFLDGAIGQIESGAK